jgi:hypothetical protein
MQSCDSSARVASSVILLSSPDLGQQVSGSLAKTM